MRYLFGAAAGVTIALTVAGCSSTGTRQANWHVWAPSTWPIFSGASKVNAAAIADEKASESRTQVQALDVDATHAAHLEFAKAEMTLRAIANRSPEVERALRFLSNGLGLLNQFDPLAGAEAIDLRALVENFASADPAKVKAAERAQTVAETDISALSKRIEDAEGRATKAETKARQANVNARVTAMENIDLANELRSYKWAALWLLLAVIVGGALLAYVRLQLGGVGAALHAAGAPADVMAKINENTSALGQWFVRTGRAAAAKAEAVLAVAKSPSTPR